MLAHLLVSYSLLSFLYSLIYSITIIYTVGNLFSISTAARYSLYWSGFTNNASFTGKRNNSFLPVWEASSFTIQAARLVDLEDKPLVHSNPPGRPASFGGNLRDVSIYFRFSDSNNQKGFISGGVYSTTILRGNSGDSLLSSHKPSYELKPGSFWAKEYNQLHNKSCLKPYRYFPGCLNLTDEPDDSYLNLSFPVGLATMPNGYYGDGIISVVLNKFNTHDADFLSPHQNFVLMLIRKFSCLLF